MTSHTQLAALACLCLGLLGAACSATETESKTMSKTSSQPAPENAQTATVGGGCFWCVEAVFDYIDGIHSTISGYAGGDTSNPTYEAVCSGSTGHAEVVQITFDPDVISYGEVLDTFFAAHDPTTLNRQGADKGTQYRSIVLYENDEQKREAEAAVKRAQKDYSDPIVTELAPLEKFYAAEQYHQDYYSRNPNIPYSKYVIEPKLKKLDLE